MRAPDERWSNWKTDTTIRREFIGGSDVAGILGISKYDTPADVWRNKIGGGGEFVGNRFTDWGTRLEASIIQWFADNNPSLNVEATSATWRHESIPFLAASPDAIVTGDRRGLMVLEAKNVGEYAAAEWVDGISGPNGYIAQVKHNASVIGAVGGWLVGLVGGNDIRVVEVMLDEADTKDTELRLEEFWRHVVALTTPDVDPAHPKAFAEFAATRVEAPGVEITLTGEAEKAWHDRDDMKRVIKNAESQIAEYDAIIAKALQGADAGLVDGRKVVSWKQTRRFDPDLVDPDLRERYATPTFDSKAFKAERPDEYEAAMAVKSTGLHYQPRRTT